MIKGLSRLLILGFLAMHGAVQTAPCISPGRASDKLFPVTGDGAFSKVGFIDSTGKLVSDFSFYSADEFSEGLARVTVSRNGKEGYIDATGRVVIEQSSTLRFPSGNAELRSDLVGSGATSTLPAV